MEASERLLGYFDPETGEIRKRMVSALLNSGDKAGAVAVLWRAMEAAEGSFGPAHPETLTAMRRLAIWSIEAGHIDAGLRLFLRMLEACERTSNSEGVLESLESIVQAGDRLRRGDDYLGAANAYVVAMRESIRLRGREHPGTRGIEQRIAEIEAENQGIVETVSPGGQEAENGEDEGDAEQIYRSVLEGAADPTEPNAVRAAVNLALLLKSKNETAEAEEIYLRLLRELACGFGPEESYGTLRALNELLHNKEAIEEAETLYRAALQRCERELGPDAASTLRCLNNLAVLLSGTGRGAEAAEMLRSYIRRKNVPEAALRYHIACVECLGGNLESAKQLISRQIQDRPHHRARALADPALSKIRDFVEACPMVPLITQECR